MHDIQPLGVLPVVPPLLSWVYFWWTKTAPHPVLEHAPLRVIQTHIIRYPMPGIVRSSDQMKRDGASELEQDECQTMIPGAEARFR
jgi:hypothetical protein